MLNPYGRQHKYADFSFIVRASAAAVFLLITYTRLGEFDLAMNNDDSGGAGGGIPLDTFNKNTPPGWRPGNAKYPLRRYIQLLRLWWRQTELPEHAAGPAMAGRLRGAAFQLAMKMKMDRLDLAAGNRREMEGDELLARPSHPEWQDANGVQHQAEPAGASLLMDLLVREFEVQDQDMSIVALSSFFSLNRGHLPMNDFLTMFRLCFEEAQDRGGLQLNNVGKSFLLLQMAGLSERMRTDLRMQIHGDLNRFPKLIALMQRMANHEFQGTSSSIPSMVSQYWTDEAAYWQSDGGSEYDSPETWATDGSWSWIGYDDDFQDGSW